jgi:hypothetical protein
LESDNIPSGDEIAGEEEGKMDTVLALIPGVLILILGGIGIIWGVYSLVKEKSILGLIIFCLLLGVVSATLGSLDSKGLLDTEWTFVGLNAMTGIILILGNIASLYSPPSPKAPGWTQWAGLGIGAFFVWSAIERGWHHYWH